MEFDQILFKKFVNIYDRLFKRQSEEATAHVVQLEDLSSRLTLFARALTGANVEIMAAELEGGWKNNQFFLPLQMSILPTLEQNLNFYLYRLVYLSVQWELKLNWDSTIEVNSLEESRKKAKAESQLVLDVIKDEYPTIHSFFDEVNGFFGEEQAPDYWLFGKYMIDKDIIENEEDESFDRNTTGKDSVSAKTEIKSKAVEEAEILKVDKKKQDDYVLNHNFEKVETAEEFSGIWRGFDGDDTIQEDEDALSELNLRHLVRTDEVAESIYQADFRDLDRIAESADVETEAEPLLYDEWNFKKQQYKRNHCKVFVRKIPNGDLKYANDCIADNQKTLLGLRRKFSEINQIRRIVKKLPDGERLDIDALIDWHVDIQSGKTPSENIYYSKRKKESDLAILFLLDLSFSTDSYADGNRVLDVEKQAVILFGEVLEEYQVEFAIGGFYSKTRNNCTYLSIKSFKDNWLKGKQNLGEVQPEGYTRIGPALRHASELVKNQGARNKWIILLSDGKPNDYDQYEGKYGVADVKQALREMNAEHVSSYAVAIESVAKFYLPQMFGHNHYNILSHPDMLVSSLANLYRRIQNA